jgi:hypothetical protein
MIASRSREPNGRLRRRHARADEALVALTASQPHRRGEHTNAGATPWQRAIKSGRIRNRGGYTGGQLEQAGLAFAEVRENYLRAIGAPRGFISRRGKGSDLPPSLRRKWLRQWSDACAALGKAPLLAILGAVEAHPEEDERLWTRNQSIAVSDALKALCGHFHIG